LWKRNRAVYTLLEIQQNCTLLLSVCENFVVVAYMTLQYKHNIRSLSSNIHFIIYPLETRFSSCF
jgi:hypothetical protein